jgi:hypothetical protein
MVTREIWIFKFYIMDKLLKDLCYRLPYRLKGRLEDTEGELVGINLKDPQKPTVDVLVPGYKSPWTCDYTMFRPFLKPLFPTIYEKQSDGRVPWLEYKKRWYDEGLIGTGKTGSEFLNNLVSWEFKRKQDKWWHFEGKIRYGEKVSDIFEIATFYHHLAWSVAYEMGIDVNGLIEEGKALLWTH